MASKAFEAFFTETTAGGVTARSTGAVSTIRCGVVFVVAVTYATGGIGVTTPTISDTLGTTWGVYTNAVSGNLRLNVWYNTSAFVGGTDTFTVTPGVACTCVVDVFGWAQTRAIGSGNSGIGTSTAPLTAALVASLIANEMLMIGICAFDGSTTMTAPAITAVPSPPTTETLRQSVVAAQTCGVQIFWGHPVNVVATQASATLGSSVDWFIQLFTASLTSSSSFAGAQGQGGGGY